MMTAQKPRIVNPQTVDVIAVHCPECGAVTGEPCHQLPDRKPHVMRRITAYATPGRHHLAAVRDTSA